MMNLSNFSPNLRRLPVALLALLLSLSLSAQKPSELKDLGLRYFANAQWEKAENLLAQYQQRKPGEMDVLLKLGIANYHLHRSDKALSFLEYVNQQNPTGQIGTEAAFYLARTLHGRQEYERAITAYKNFMRLGGEGHSLYKYAATNIWRCSQGMHLRPNPDVALVENLGDRVNSSGDEYAPLPSVNYKNRLYFASARPGATGGRRNEEGYEDTLRGAWCSDMYIAQQRLSGWELESGLNSLLNTARHEAPLAFGNEGRVLLFSRGFTPFSGDVFADTSGRKDEYATATPRFNSAMQPENGDVAPYFFADSFLVFASRRAGGQGGLDLYWSVLRDGNWMEAQAFPTSINSAFDETTPWLAPDGRTLYFSSNRLESIGGFDVFKSRFNVETQSWSVPENMGTPLNSPGNDTWFRPQNGENAAFLSSDRLDSYGGQDIYLVYFKQQPEGFGQIGDFFALSKPKSEVMGANVVKEIAVAPLYYNSDRDIFSTENNKILDAFAAALRPLPAGSTVMITVFTDETGPVKFDLYNGIKRAELLGKALTERGIPAEKIKLLSCGPGFPAARNVLDGRPSEAGQRLNRRAELSLRHIQDEPALKIKLERPLVAEYMAAAGTARYEELSKGLSYRVEVANTRQLLNTDALSMFSDLLISSQTGSGQYLYSAGWVRQYKEAAQLKAELQKQDFPEARVVACLNGLPLSKPEAIALLKKYPDLMEFVRN